MAISAKEGTSAKDRPYPVLYGETGFEALICMEGASRHFVSQVDSEREARHVDSGCCGLGIVDLSLLSLSLSLSSSSS